MNSYEKKIIGCSFDGLKDRFFIYGNNSPTGTDFFLADVVLPSHNGGRFLAGKEAECNRVSSGFHWPPDAQVKVGHHLRRIPVPWAWRLVIDAKDRYQSWSIGGGVSFKITKILAVHIAERLGDNQKDADEIIIAIPNDLDEYGQEELIKDLVSQGVGTRNKRPRLVWRPVAASLAWLDKVQGQFPNPIKDDFILVVHIGPDCVEFVTLHLREKTHEGKRFVIPVRETPQVDKYSLCGCDWAVEFIKQEFNTNEPGEVWQGFTNFPETWEALAQQSWNMEGLPRVWSRGNSWELWEPDEACQQRIWQLEAKVATCLEELTKENFKHSRSDKPFDSWQKFLQNGVKNALSTCKDGKLCGMILSGPLASTNPVFWIDGIIDLLQGRGLSTSVEREAKINSIWAPTFNEDIISEGASIYGSRISRNEPTYLDTIPRLDTLADKRGKQDWEPLLGKLEIEGGKKYSNTLEKCFSLKRDSKNLEVYLKKGVSKVFKKALFSFPYAPRENMPLDMNICVASANGLAQVELIPENKEFLGGQRVFMDYSRMTETNELPEPKLGFPHVADNLISSTDYRINTANFQQICDDFLNANITDQKYEDYIGKLRHEIRTPTFWRMRSYRIVNKDGKTGTGKGQIIINEISKKLGSDFKEILLGKIAYANNRKKIYNKLLGASTWLFGAAPPEVLIHLRRELEGERVKSNIVNGAGRCFTKKDDFVLLFKAAIRRIHIRNSLTIQWSLAIWNVLLLREYAPDAMEKEYARIFVEYALGNMEGQTNIRNFKQTFFQSIKLFVCILRFRVKDSTFLSYEIQNEKERFERIIFCLEVAQKFFKNAGRNNRNIKAEKLMEEIKKYMHYEGTGNIISIIDELADVKE